MAGPSARRLGPLLGLAIPLALYGWLAAWNVARPGLYGDEALQSGPATIIALGGGERERAWGALTLEIGDRLFPVMTNDYIGPVKTYLVAISFKLFGAGIQTLRLTTIALGGVAVAATALALARLLGWHIAGPAALLLAADPGFVLGTRHDWGPVAFNIAAKSVILLCVASLVTTSATWPSVALGLTAGLGLAHKIDFSWFLLALLVSGPLVYGSAIRCRLGRTMAAAAAFMIGASPIIAFNIVQPWQTLQSYLSIMGESTGTVGSPVALLDRWFGQLGETVPRRLSALDSVLRGDAIATWILHQSVPMPFGLVATPFVVSVAVAVGLLAVLWGARCLPPRNWPRPVAFFGLVIFVTALQMALLPMPFSAHHILASFYPLLHIMAGIIVGGCWLLAVNAGLYRAVAIRTLLLAAVGATVLWNTLYVASFHREIENRGGFGAWSEAIVSLANVLDNREPARVVAMDWGIRDPVITVTQGRIDPYDGFWGLGEDRRREEDVRRWIADPTAVFVLRSPPFTAFPRARAAFGRILNETCPDLAIEARTIADVQGRDVYEIVTLSRCAP